MTLHKSPSHARAFNSIPFNLIPFNSIQLNSILFIHSYLLGVSFAGGNFNDPPQPESLHAPGVLQTALAVLDPPQEELDVLPLASVVVSLQFPADGVSRRQNQQVQQPLGFRLHFTAQAVYK
jgi:hypothetical protein